MKNYTWYLFDLDNTILDFNTASKLAFDDTLKNCKISLDKNHYAVYHNINKSYWTRYEKGLINAQVLREGRFKDFLKEIQHEFDAIKMGEIYLENLLHNSHEILGARETLEKLNKNSKLALITNGLSDVQHKRIAKHQIKDYFQHIFISDEMGVSKPANKFFEIVHQQILKPNKKEVLVLGDNPISDIEGANNFGYDSLFFNYENKVSQEINATYKIDSWKQFIF